MTLNIVCVCACVFDIFVCLLICFYLGCFDTNWMSLPGLPSCGRVGCRQSCADPPEGEGQVKPRANKQACLPTLKNMGP